MVNMENYEEYMLLYADRELSAEEEQALLRFVAQHPQLQAELEAYAATRLQPDVSIVYADKEQLLKTAPAGRSIGLGNWKLYAAAASVVLFITLFAINNRRDTQEVETPVLVKETITAPVTNPAPMPEQAEQSASEKKVHSTKPVNAIAVRTNHRKPTPKPTIEKEVVPPLQPTYTAPIAQTKNDTATQPIAVADIPKPAMEAKDVETPATKVPEETAPKKNNVFASVVGDKTVGLERLETAVNSKLLEAKNITKELKNTDVTFQIGKRELFTVRL